MMYVNLGSGLCIEIAGPVWLKGTTVDDVLAPTAARNAERTTLRRKVYVLLDPAAWPRSGLSPVNALLVGIIIASTLSAILETEPLVAQGHERAFAAAEMLFGIVFLIEYLARLWTAVESPHFGPGWRGRLRFARSPAAILDVLAIAPLFMVASASPMVLRLFRFLRIIRLAKLGRMSQAAHFLVEAVKSRRYELGLTAGLAVVVMIISATSLYWAEGEAQPGKFGSIPRALWWSLITLTTIGYGDVYPITPAGKVLSGITALAGIGLIALPTGIFAAAFSDIAQRARQDKRQ